MYDKIFGIYGIIVGEKIPSIEKLTAQSSIVILVLFLASITILAMSYKAILLAKLVAVELDKVIDNADVRK